jgi:hypothetical protein
MTSFNPGISDATTGTPAAWASKAVSPNASALDGRTKQSTPA